LHGNVKTNAQRRHIPLLESNAMALAADPALVGDPACKATIAQAEV
jgi:hypothetical protein